MTDVLIGGINLKNVISSLQLLKMYNADYHSKSSGSPEVERATEMGLTQQVAQSQYSRIKVQAPFVSWLYHPLPV